jgi:putative lipoic acid-binding regulatory protein
VITHTLYGDCTKKRIISGMTSPSIPPENIGTESLIEYPSLFPIKVMGLKAEGLIDAVRVIAEQFDPTFDVANIELRESSGGKYLGVTITVTATSRVQLDDLYRTLSSHPMVKVVL